MEMNSEMTELSLDHLASVSGGGSDGGTATPPPPPPRTNSASSNTLRTSSALMTMTTCSARERNETLAVLDRQAGILSPEGAVKAMLQRVSEVRRGQRIGDVEPLLRDHPFRSLDNVLATPHIGYVARELYRTFYGDTVKNIERWLVQQSR